MISLDGTADTSSEDDDDDDDDDDKDDDNDDQNEENEEYQGEEEVNELQHFHLRGIGSCTDRANKPYISCPCL